jgi:hypothetical protein
MKRYQLLVLSVLTFGLQGVAQASPYPADAEASLGLPGIETVSFAVDMGAQASAYPADAEASLGLPGNGDRATAWGVSERDAQSGSPFPVGVGFIADE